MADNGQHISAGEIELLSQLREILLKEDRVALAEIQQILNEKDLLAQKVSPIIEDHLENLRKNFPQEYAKIVNRQIEQKLKSSQQEIIDVIYPALGKMITKFIGLQFQELKDGIDERVNSIFSKQGLLGWFKYKLFGFKDKDAFIADIDKPVLEEVFFVQKNTGLLLGNATLNPTDNRDVVAGMLTAIKSFVEDAFQKNDADLDMIQYGTYRILLHNFPNYYCALALKGSISTKEETEFRNKIINFVQNTEGVSQRDITTISQEKLSLLIENQFFKLNYDAKNIEL
jgi:DNA-binding transcriptional MerR regulator